MAAKFGHNGKVHLFGGIWSIWSYGRQIAFHDGESTIFVSRFRKALDYYAKVSNVRL
jgi:hypothetical protein